MHRFHHDIRMEEGIRLATKFLRFFRKFYFYFLTSRIQLALNNVCSITIYDWSPMLRQRKDPTFIEVLGLLAKEVDEVRFEIVLVIEFFLM